MRLTGPDSRFLTVLQAAELLQLHPQTVRRKVALGQIPAVRVGLHGPIRIDSRSLEAHLQPIRGEGLLARLSPERRAAHEAEQRREASLQIPFDERLSTALHESGHAVVSLALGCYVRKVSIVPSDGRSGYCDTVHRRALDGFGAELVEELEQRALVDVAGYVASHPMYARLEEVACHEEASGLAWLRRAYGPEAPAKLKEITARCADLLSEPLHRDRLTLLAAALVSRIELVDGEILEAIRPAGLFEPEAIAAVRRAERTVGR